jgi:hypothetical protein
VHTYTNVPVQTVVFALDNQTLRGMYQFTRYTDQQTALGNCGKVGPIIGMYKGKPETAFIMDIEDYKNLSIPVYTVQQESVIVVNNDMSCYLANPVSLAPLKKLGKLQGYTELPKGAHSWTYSPSLNTYYIAG